MSETELRAMVREVLGDILKARRGDATSTASPAPAQTPAAPVVESVPISSNGELAAFVQRLIGDLADPAKGAAIRSGAHVFALAGGQGAGSPAPVAAVAAAPGPEVELSGTVTESKVNRLGKLGGTERIVLAPDAVLTPLAQDRARALGFKIERKR